MSYCLKCINRLNIFYNKHIRSILTKNGIVKLIYLWHLNVFIIALSMHFTVNNVFFLHRLKR